MVVVLHSTRELAGTTCNFPPDILPYDGKWGSGSRHVLLSIKVRHLVEDPKLSNGMRCLMSRDLPVLIPICSRWPSS